MSMDGAADRARQPLHGTDAINNGGTSPHWRGGLTVLEDAMPGDVLVAVAGDHVLVASSRQELVLAVMEAVHDSDAASGSMRHPEWVHAIAQSSGRLSPRLLAGCVSGAVLDALSGEAPSSTIASGGAQRALHCFCICCPTIADDPCGRHAQVLESNKQLQTRSRNCSMIMLPFVAL